MRGWLVAFGLAAGIVSPSLAVPTWSADELAMLRMLSPGAALAPPADPSNRVADDPQAAALGRSLFFDAGLSDNGKVSCASCHQPERGFTDGLPVGRGLSDGARRTMPVASAVHSPWQFWDGRADSLWAQALGPVENPVEHGFTRTQVAHALAAQYRGPYERLFPALPASHDLQRIPQRASPVGDAQARAAWGRMAAADQRAVNLAFANFGKAIAAYERTLTVQPGRFDRYVAGLFARPGGSAGALSTDERAGLRLFIGKGQCANCHNGPLFSNGGFANTGVPPRPGHAPDRGRDEGVRKALDDPFNCKGAFSDAPPARCDELEFAVTDSPEQVGAFKVPSLRGVSQRAPYMHAGQLTSMDEVLDHYNRAPASAVGHSELQPLGLTSAERRQIVAFLRTLDETTPATSPRKARR